MAEGMALLSVYGDLDSEEDEQAAPKANVESDGLAPVESENEQASSKVAKFPKYKGGQKSSWTEELGETTQATLGSTSSGGSPTFLEDLDAGNFTLPTLLDYFGKCNPGLPNAASCTQVYRLVRLYKKGVATKAQTKHLYEVLLYRFEQDLRAGHILSFLRISRVCHIFNFKQWECDMTIMSPYLKVVRLVYPFDEPPKTTPPSYRYSKPVVYLAYSAYKASVDVSWFKQNLELYKCEAPTGEGEGCS